jgi:hypothetical protein
MLIESGGDGEGDDSLVFADDDQQVCDVIVFECACMSVL